VVTPIAPLLCISDSSTNARAMGRWVQGNGAWPLRYHVDHLTTQLRGGAITSAHTSSPSLFAALSWLAHESGGEKWPDQPFASSPVSARSLEDRANFDSQSDGTYGSVQVIVWYVPIALARRFQQPVYICQHLLHLFHTSLAPVETRVVTPEHYCRSLADTRSGAMPMYSRVTKIKMSSTRGKRLPAGGRRHQVGQAVPRYRSPVGKGRE
jgi:hypothetical protein